MLGRIPAAPPEATAPCAIIAVLAVDGQDEMLDVPVEPEAAVGPVYTPVAAPAL